MLLSILGILVVLLIIYLAWEIHRAPLMPDDYEEEVNTNVVKNKESEIKTEDTIQ